MHSHGGSEVVLLSACQLSDSGGRGPRGGEKRGAFRWIVTGCRVRGKIKERRVEGFRDSFPFKSTILVVQYNSTKIQYRVFFAFFAFFLMKTDEDRDEQEELMKSR